MLTYRDPEYWRNLRPETVEGWPDKDPEPEVSTKDPRPADAPKDPKAVRDLVNLLAEAGWPALIGYSRGLVRAQKTGTYTRKEHLGVWTHAAHGWRIRATYSRTVGRGSWTWGVCVWRTDGRPVAGKNSPMRFTHCSISDLKEFVSVRGAVIPMWFKSIVDRVEEQKRKQAAAAKARPKKKEGAS